MSERQSGSLALSWAVASFGHHRAVVATWDFTVHGGSFGAADADALSGCVDDAIDQQLPLVTRLRSGGTRLTEGMRALVGIPRAVLAMKRLHEAGLPQIAVCDQPTTGGVWVALGSVADVRIGVTGATVAFSGPRVVEAMTGRPFPPEVGTAQAAHRTGLLDVVVAPAGLSNLLETVLEALAPDAVEPADRWVSQPVPAVAKAWEHVTRSRKEPRPGGRDLIDALLTARLDLAGADDTVAATLGRLAGHRVVAVALAATRETMPSAAGFGLLIRAAQLASRIDAALVVLVDTPGADPHTEAAGLAASIAEAMTAVLECRSPTVALVHGAGGSGGALAGAVTDLVGVGPHGWFAALAPEGAAAALRRDLPEVTDLMHVTPADLISQGFADTFVPTERIAEWLSAGLVELRARPVNARLRHRYERWSHGLPESS